jgi:Tfp pilus assembly protein PilV
MCGQTPLREEGGGMSFFESHREKNVGRYSQEAGLTLVEVMVAFVVLLIVMIPFSYTLIAQVQSSVISKQRLTAIGLAEKWVETLSNTTPPVNSLGGPAVGVFAPPVISGSPAVQLVAGSTYSSDVEYSWAASGPAPDLCQSGVPQVLDLQVNVYWDGTRHFVTDNALIDYPTHGVQTLGFLAVQLTNSTTITDNYGNLYPTRVQSVPVKIVGPSPATSSVTLYPDSNGCVFTEANPGAYTVAVSDPSPNTPTGSNYGTPQFVANLATQPTSPPLTPVTVATGKTSSVQYQYDESSPVQVNYSVNGVVQTGSISGIPLEVYNANLNPSTYWNIYATGHASAATALPGLYPFTDGYSIFAGDCASESTTAGVVPITTNPGTTTSVTVPLASVTIQVQVSSTLVAIPGASVSLVANDGSGCPADTYLFATTNSSGSTNTLLVPFGSYTLKITASGFLSLSVPLVVTNVNSGVPIPEVMVP